MRNLKLTIQYDGTKYCGWQKQPNSPGIQGTIEYAIYEITKEKAVYLDVLDKECKNLQSQLDEYLSKKYPLLTSCWLLSFELPCR